MASSPSHQLKLICEVPISDEFRSDLVLIQENFNVEQVKAEPQALAKSYLLLQAKGLTFVDEDLGMLHLDFRNDLNNYSRNSHRGKSELIAKALGLPKAPQVIFDGTLGLAQDAWFLSQLGAQVEGCERSPLIYLLLSDALRRSQETKLKINFGDSRHWLSNTKKKYTSIYLDPMFPEKKKSALPRKEMQIFRKWVGEDADALDLFSSAMQSGAERVVVKRPLKSGEFHSGVVHSFRGTTVRYDLYSPRKENL